MIHSPKYGNGLHSRLRESKPFHHVKEELRKQNIRRMYDMSMGFQTGYSFADNIYYLILGIFRPDFIPLDAVGFIMGSK